jgi:hypothetical protein
METVEEQIRFVEEHIRKALEHFIGEPPVLQDIRKKVEETLREITPPMDFSTLTEILTLPFMSFEQRRHLNVRKMAEQIPDAVLAWFVERLRGDIAGTPTLLYIELLRRKGDIKDWSSEMTEEGMMTTYTLNSPIEFIHMDFIVGPESKEP